MTKRTTLAEFAELFERETGFDLMDRNPGESPHDHAMTNIQWLRDWAQETADKLERVANRMAGAP